MSVALSGALDERWAEYLRLREQNAHYAAFVRLGEIANCVLHAGGSPKVKSKWVDMLAQIKVSTDVLRSIKSEALKKIERVERILSGGGAFAYEEALLVITLRVELDMLLAYLAERGFVEFLDASSVDEQLQAVASAPQNSSVYRSAQQSARRNWGVPLHSKWLGTDSMH